MPTGPPLSLKDELDHETAKSNMTNNSTLIYSALLPYDDEVCPQFISECVITNITLRFK